LAKEHDAQIFIERVIRNDDDAQECQVIIEDGVVKEPQKPESILEKAHKALIEGSMELEKDIETSVLTDADFEDI